MNAQHDVPPALDPQSPDTRPVSERLPRLTPVPHQPHHPSAILHVTAAVLFIVSMPLLWHRELIPALGLHDVRGIDGASWLIVAGAIAALIALHNVRRTPAFSTVWASALLTFCVLIGMFADYINWKGDADAVNENAYYGPGFFVGVTGMLVLLASTVVVWRAYVT